MVLSTIKNVLWRPRTGATTAGSNRCSGDPWCGSIFSSRSRHRHILPPRRVLRRAPLLLHSPVLALVGATSGA